MQKIFQKEALNMFVGAIIGITITLIGALAYNWYQNNTRMNKYYEEYYFSVENLLDEISLENEDFMDTIGSGDCYQNYLEKKNELNVHQNVQ